MEAYTTVRQAGCYTYEDRKSIFIGAAFPVSTEAEALAHLSDIKKKFPDARHHVYAYLLRDNALMRYSDDHEPQGTAGLPVLDVIRKKGLCDVLVVVTRYFGGTLLGTGGLVRAYTEAAVGALEAGGVITYSAFLPCMLCVSYADYQKIQGLLPTLGFCSEHIEYAAQITLTGKIKTESARAMEEKITDVLGGRAEILFFDEIYSYVND